MEISALTETTAPAVDDFAPMYDTSLAANRKMSVATLRQDIPNSPTGSYVLALTDAGKTVWMNVAGANILTIPLEASVAFTTNTVIVAVQLGAGTTTVEGITGVTFNGVTGGSGDLGNRYASVTLVKTGSDTWVGIRGGMGIVA
jgi:hypothetical protein